MSDDRDLNAVPDSGNEWLGEVFADLLGPWTVELEWPTCRCGATAVRWSTGLCRDCTAVAVSAGAR